MMIKIWNDDKNQAGTSVGFLSIPSSTMEDAGRWLLEEDDDDADDADNDDNDDDGDHDDDDDDDDDGDDDDNDGCCNEKVGSRRCP